MRSLLVVYSYHHKNTLKVATVMGQVLDAQIKRPKNVDPDEVQGYDLVGFGSGIDSGKNYGPLLEFADRLPRVADKKAFIFSTAGITGPEKVAQDHKALMDKLQAKGYLILGEFGCKGFNTNSFLKYFGGMNKASPDPQDLENAKRFAQDLKGKMSGKGRKQ